MSFCGTGDTPGVPCREPTQGHFGHIRPGPRGGIGRSGRDFAAGSPATGGHGQGVEKALHLGCHEGAADTSVR